MNHAISILGLRLPTHVGVTDEELAGEQNVIVDLFIDADLSRAAKSDDVSETVDYAAVIERVADVVRGNRTRLLETLADKIAAAVAAFSAVDGVTVEVAKERIPVDEEVGRVAVRVHRA